MKPHLRSLSENSVPENSTSPSPAILYVSAVRQRALRWPLAALTIAGVLITSYRATAQTPTAIPNWTTEGPGTTSGQYAPNPYPQQAPADGQRYGAPQSEPAPAYGQPPQQAFDGFDQGGTPPYQPNRALSPDQLEQLVAPVALYPDNLLSMILAASTYPAQVSAADQWVHMQGGASPDQIAAGASAQTSWDPSVKALTAFPQVLDELAQNLQWTTDLGNAYYNQPQDVMQTVQLMRSRAQTAGNLQTTPQEVVTEDQGNIEIAPPTPNVVYVPQYDPWAVYGQPVNPYPSFNWVGAIGSFIGGAFIHWGPGIAMNAFAATPFGWMGWGLDWLLHAIFFNHDFWCTHSYSVHDWGFAHGGGRYWGPHGEMAAFRARGGFTPHAFRSGLDRASSHGGFDRGGSNNAGRGSPRAFPGGNPSYGNRGNESYGRGFQNNGNAWARGNYGETGRSGFGYGADHNGYSANGSYGDRAYNRVPQSIGRPQQFDGSARSFYGSQRAGGGQQFDRTPAYGNYGGREAFGNGGYGQTSRAPIYGGENRSYSYGGSGGRGYGAYNGSNNYARNPSGGGFQMFGSGRSNNTYADSFRGGSYKQPRSSGFGGRSWGGGSYKAPKEPKAPHFSGGGHSFGGGGHHSGGGGHGGKHH